MSALVDTRVTVPRRERRRCPLRGILSGISIVALVALWAAVVRPESVGGAIGYVMVSGESMEPGLHTGDLVITRKREHYRPGDVIAYRIPEGETGAGAMVIHRIVGGSPSTGYVTLGDNRDTEDLWRPKDGDVIGRMVFDVPGAGRWMARIRAPLPLAVLAALVVLLFWTPPPRRAAPQPRSARAG